MKALFFALALALSQGMAQTEDTTIKFNRAAELQRQGKLKEAAAEYQALLRHAPQYAEAHANLGVVLAQMNRYEEAVAAYESALRLAPQLTPILLNIGIAHYRAGQFEKAAAAFEQLLARAPSSIQARQLLGLSLIELGRDIEALTHLEQSLAAAPDDAAILFSLGSAYLRLNRPELRTMIERLAKLPTGLAASHLLKGQAFLGSFEYERALAELELAAKLNAKLPRLQYSLGLAYLKLNRHKEAFAAFERELTDTPHDFSTLYYLAYLHEANSNIEAARQRLDAALKLEPQSPEANALLGKILVRQGKLAEAVAPLEAAVARDPVDSEKRYQLARVYQQLGRREDAAHEFAEVQRLKANRLKSDRARTPQP